MTTYTAITAGEVGADKPIIDTLMSRLWLNPIAMFEGAAGAPKLQLAAVDTWLTTAGGVGTYALAWRIVGTTDVAFGGTLAGSNLAPTIALAGPQGGAGGTPIGTGSALSGTWQAMGRYLHSASVSGNATAASTLWQRIA